MNKYLSDCSRPSK